MPACVRDLSADAKALPVERSFSVARNCSLQPYKKIKVPAFDVTEDIIAFASPDSTYAVTKRLLEAATSTILIGIYDFTAPHMKTLLLGAMSRGVKVTLMLDVEPGVEQNMFTDLMAMGLDGVVAPACSSPKVLARYFSSCHEKFIIIDGSWTIVQSGNYSSNSIPLNEKDGGDPLHFVKGNRDSGLAVKSKPMASFFTKLLRSDIALQLKAPQSKAAQEPLAAPALWVEAAPKLNPKTLFPSKRFKLGSALNIQPVLSPDNYMSTMPAVLQSAKRSILIEQQYIRASQPNVALLLAAIRQAIDKNPALDVRIVLGKIFDISDLPQEQQNIKLLKDKFGLELGRNIRYIDTTRFVHCHNKMIVVDGSTVLVSSQNWSDSAVTKNREAGLLLTHTGIARYFTGIFENDWETAFQKIPVPGKAQIASKALRAGGFVQVVPADYREV